MKIILARLVLLLFVLVMTGCSKEEAEKVSSVLAKETVTSSETESDTKDKRPNVLLIVADDLGFNDISLHGSEIQTPNIDQLIKEGVFFSDFHVAPNCSPTRAMLLSGTDNHIAGLGNMAESLAPNQLGRPGYEGHLNFNIAALPELFQDAGYHTYMTGKWHLGLTEETSPTARGFEKSFILAQGGAGAFSNMLQLFGPNKAIYRENGKKLESLPEDFYSTQFYTDRMIEYIDENKADDKPFFSYLAYTSPHWPLQALRESIEKYSGVYDDGYEALKQRRFQSLKDLGLIEEDAVAFPRFSDEAGWDTLSEEEKKYQARLMEIYAAMVNDVDVYIGKLIEHLKAIGEYDNTFIFFLADNGPEAHNLEEAWEGMSEYVASCCDNSYENIGSANSYVWYGQNWGQAGNTPRRMYKGFTTQGGVQVPAFAHYPKSLPQGLRNNEILHVMDVMPTLLELAGIEHPGTNYRGRDVAEMKGESMLSMLTGKSERVHNEEYVIGWELFSKRAVRKGDWKIVYEPFHKVLEPRVAGIQTDKWQLYNLAQDPIELNDLSETHSEKLAEMIAYWDQYVADSGLVIPDSWEGY